MAEPVSSTATTASLLAVALLTLFPGMDPDVVLGAFAGASVFVISATDLPLFKRFTFFILSFTAGLLAARMVAGIIDTALPAEIEVAESVGAMAASALAIKLLLWLIQLAEDPAKAVRDIKKGGS
ncbi:phage holin family protein [Aquitalea sp. ASV11]|uniref:phage holin family protein n=1 Tax=Aquitalea sp. ASV11 TaxID=2795103 RepID=UPI0018ECBFD8|nr:phage holin family protein [Aquitalea sp. ASV11]